MTAWYLLGFAALVGAAIVLSHRLVEEAVDGPVGRPVELRIEPDLAELAPSA